MIYVESFNDQLNSSKNHTIIEYDLEAKSLRRNDGKFLLQIIKAKKAKIQKRSRSRNYLYFNVFEITKQF